MRFCLRPILLMLLLLYSGVGIRFAGAQSPLSLDVTAGLGTGIGGPQARYRTGAAVDALLALRVRSLPHGAILVGLAAGGQGAPTREDVCILTPRGDCLPEFPLFGSVGPLVGWESPAGMLRLMGGAGWFASEDERQALGLTGRVDAAAPALLIFAPVLSLRGALLPRYQGDMIVLLSVGVGLRIR